MKKILFIRDHSALVDPLLKFARSLAAKMQAGLLLAQTTFTKASVQEKVLPESSSGTAVACHDDISGGSQVINVSAMDTPAMAQWINHERLNLVISCSTTAPGRISPDVLVNRVQCPLLLLPGNWVPKDFRSIGYLADLRYCRSDILYWLAKFAAACRADLSVIQLTKPGLVHIEESYAHRIFDEQVSPIFDHDRLSFYYTREDDVAKAADVLLNGMHHDLLVVTGNRYHHKALPPDIPAPLLIFPG